MTQLGSAAVGIRTLAELPFRVAERFDRPAMIRRCVGDQYTDVSARDYLERTRAFSLGLQALGLSPGDRAGIVCESRPEWTITDQAFLTARAVTVPVYPTLSASQTQFILHDAEATVVVVSDDTQASKVREFLGSLPSVKALVVIEPGTGVTLDAAGTVPVLSMADVEASGRRRLELDSRLADRYRAGVAAIQPTDVATIIYTSGTTGNPKGVVLTHRNVVANLQATNEVLHVTPADMALSFLPLSHTFERLAIYLFLHFGATVVFAESLQTVARDLERVGPTIMTGVPRVYEKYHAAVLEKISGAPPIRQKLFGWALGVGHRVAQARLNGEAAPLAARLQAPVAEALVWKKIRVRTGGRMRLMISGSAPLARSTADFFFAIQMPIFEGYGLTETSPVLTVNPPDAPRLGRVGRAIPGVELKIAEDGEILARGPNVMQGYYKRPEETAAVLKDGWFHTGDVGFLDDDGYLAITDRKKDLIVTSGGKNIAPQPIEQRIKRSPLVTEVVLVGDRRNFPAALIIPNFVELRARLGAAAQAADHDALVRLPETQVVYQAIIDEINVELAQFERIKRFAVLPTEVSIEGGELTPTMKLRRRVMEERWAAVIEQLYVRDVAASV